MFCPLLNPVLLSSFVSSFLTHSEGAIVSLDTIIGSIDNFQRPRKQSFSQIFLDSVFPRPVTKTSDSNHRNRSMECRNRRNSAMNDLLSSPFVATLRSGIKLGLDPTVFNHIIVCADKCMSTSPGTLSPIAG